MDECFGYNMDEKSRQSIYELFLKYVKENCTEYESYISFIGMRCFNEIVLIDESTSYDDILGIYI